MLPTNIGEALIILCSVMFFPFAAGEALLPVLPVQILSINLVATVALALPLAFEAAEPDVMRRKPRASDEPVFSGFVLFRTIFVAVLMAVGAIGLFLYEFFVARDHGQPVDVALREAQTMAVTTVIFFQIFYLLNCRSLRDSMFKIPQITLEPVCGWNALHVAACYATDCVSGNCVRPQFSGLARWHRCACI